MSILHLSDSPIPDDGLKSEPVTTAHCAQCGASVPKTSRFCPDCGAATSTACSHCGVAIPATAKFCLECGASQGAQEETRGSSELSPVPDQPMTGTTATPDEGASELFSASFPGPEESKSGSKRVLLIVGAIAGAVIICALVLFLHQRAVDQGPAEAYFERGETLKHTDLGAARNSFELGLSLCPDCPHADLAREELKWIVPALTAEWKRDAESKPAESATIRDPDDCGMGFKRGKHYIPDPNGLNDDLAVIGCSYGVSFDMACSMTCDPKPVDVRIVQ